MTRILLVRHALTDTTGKLLAGRMPGVHLNAAGIEQAKSLARRLADLPIDAVYCSPLERALETCLPLTRLLKILPIICEDLNEIDFGEWTGSKIEDIKTQTQFQLFNSFRSVTRIPGGELMAEAQVRMIRGLEKICEQHKNKTVFIVSHGDPIKAAIAYYAGIHTDMMQRIEVSPASVSIIEISDETARICTVNNTGKIGV